MQYLFNWRLFYNEKCTNFPSKLCFPQYFYLTIISILQHYHKTKNKQSYHTLKVLEIFYDDLQIIVDIIFNGDEKIKLKNPKEIKSLVENLIETKDTEMFYLETFILDETSRLNYQNALLRQSLDFYEKKNVTDIIPYLCASDCCSVEDEKDSTLDSPPHSKHYVTYGTNCTLKQYFSNNTFGPNIWGPFYWKIFHALPAAYIDDNTIRVLDNYLRIFPILIPCEFCRRNYYVYIKPSKLPTITSIEEAATTYSNIHNLVTKHKRNIILR